MLGLRGNVSFESHNNDGGQTHSKIEEDLEQMNIASTGIPIVTRARAKQTVHNRGKKHKVPAKHDSFSRRKGGPADQFCILERPGEGKALFLAIEYKPLHKLTLDNIIAGLDSEIRSAEDVIGKDDKSFEFLSKALVTAVIVQLFSAIVKKGIRSGYVCTGKANIFIHIPAEPSAIYYGLSIPKLDYSVVFETYLSLLIASV